MSLNRKLRDFQGTDFSLKSKICIVLWLFTQFLFFKFRIFPSLLRTLVLRAFGAKIGSKVIFRNGVKIHFPWNLEIGNNCWVGEDVWFINHEKVTIGSDVCVSQRSIICSGGHDYRSVSLEYNHKPITIQDGAWICLDAKVLPGVTVGECSVVSAGEIVRKSIPNYSMFIDGQVLSIEPPKK